MSAASVTSDILRLFVNTLTPDDKYSRRYIEIFLQQIQTPLSQKGMPFFRFFYYISEMCMKFKTSWNKKEYPSLIITEIIAAEENVYLNV